MISALNLLLWIDNQRIEEKAPYSIKVYNVQCSRL